MKIGIIQFPGSNCDRDAATAIRHVLAESQAQMIWHGNADLPELDLVIVPGGFSYGDYLRCGAMAAHSPIMQAIKTHADQGRLVLGICNGFQVLTETGLLPGALMRNRDLSFICRPVYLRVEQTDSPFTRGYEAKQVVEIPVAHHDGNYVADEATLDALEAGGQILFRYSDATGAITDAANPNGSQRNIAGICNAQGNVAAMMPHPERVCDGLTGGTDGRALLEGIFAQAA